MIESDSSAININSEYELLPDDYAQYDLTFKLIVIGDSGVGKSSLTNKATKNIFEDKYTATIGFEFFTFNIKINNTIIKLQIWDTCGQELYRSLITNFYRNSSLAIIVYAINKKESFEDIEMWLRELRIHSKPDVKLFLIGNKIDLENEREITTKEGQSYCDKNNFVKFMEASAKAGINTKEIFIDAARFLYDDFLHYKEKVKIGNDESSEDSHSFDHELDESYKIKSKNEKKNKFKGGCC